MDTIITFIEQNIEIIYLLTFAIFLGFEVISKIPTVLHTPLMSGSNAISGVVLIGAILLIRVTESTNYLALILATLGIILGTINLVGGFAVTGRMLEMFNKKKNKKK
ncbi:NAD(P) transhydrogenase subunit alpha [Kriegella sp. EG-1]|nr:NAD(P) transhydrogenase subunit alpha [Flavobacteriaceae bacterium EG-1]